MILATTWSYSLYLHACLVLQDGCRGAQQVFHTRTGRCTFSIRPHRTICWGRSWMDGTCGKDHFIGPRNSRQTDRQHGRSYGSECRRRRQVFGDMARQSRRSEMKGPWKDEGNNNNNTAAVVWFRLKQTADSRNPACSRPHGFGSI
ncbi:hypothetical protein QBC43DRAFT_83658 [Cladorrhinum sp. PSN259]|nr:hypothetical protein QBC43DRAFT_83658 [Cladorrhinum sp. PSN259]